MLPMMCSHPPCRNMCVTSGTNVASVHVPVVRSRLKLDQSNA